MKNMAAIAKELGEIVRNPGGPTATWSIPDYEYEAGWAELEYMMRNIIADALLDPVLGFMMLSAYTGIVTELGYRLGYEQGYTDRGNGGPYYEWLTD